MADHVGRMEQGKNTFKTLMGKLTGKRPLGRPMYTWEDNIIMDRNRCQYKELDWFDSG